MVFMDSEEIDDHKEEEEKERFDQCQPVRTARADSGQHFLQMYSFSHFKAHESIQSPSRVVVRYSHHIHLQWAK